MFGSSTSPTTRTAGHARLALLRATDLAIAALTLESYCLADVAPVAAAALAAADVHPEEPPVARPELNTRGCDLDLHRPQRSRALRTRITPLASRRADAACPQEAGARAACPARPEHPSTR